MVKKIFTFLLVCISFSAAASQADTSAYQTQRLRINALLAERSAKFGQYDESLNARTGIFGFQTKKDIRNSNEILRQIVLNDNNIFKELKTLMEYKDLEVSAVKNDASQTNDRIQNYKLAIKALQDKNEQLNKDAHSLKVSKNLSNIAIALLVLFLGGILVYFTGKIKRLTNRHEKTVF
jgi:preprotein translocase subunit SecF